VDNKEFSKELEKRTKRFSVRIIRLSTTLPNTPEGRVVRNQITKAGTSIGAISGARLRYVKVKPVKHSIGWK
jgi:hypothetical protein